MGKPTMTPGGRLKPAEFEILQLQLEGLSNPEIAERLGCARQTVRYKAKRIEGLEGVHHSSPELRMTTRAPMITSGTTTQTA